MIGVVSILVTLFSLVLYPVLFPEMNRQHTDYNEEQRQHECAERYPLPCFKTASVVIKANFPAPRRDYDTTK